jgi:beta-glucosidase
MDNHDMTKEECQRQTRDLLARMTLEEKLAQLSGTMRLVDMLVMAVRYNLYPFESGRNDRLGIQPIQFTDGPHGVASGRCTCFPVSIARGATWDADLETRIGEVLGIEARSQGANFCGSVCINVLRHPGWGRAQETYGEDPWHLGVMGVAQTKGLTRHVMACAKHFAANSIERSRFYVDVQMEERTLREVYLPHFRRCVDEGVASIMSAYNKLNGHYCGQNRRLLRDILKGEWSFDGFVMSDFVFGLRDAQSGIEAGLDMEMPFTHHYGRRLKRLVKKGTVPLELIDDAVTRILRQKLRYAGISGRRTYDKSQVACDGHRQLALEAARKSLVLLRNDCNLLPLERDAIRSLAVIGKLARKANLGDRGSSRVRPPYAVTPLAGIRAKAGPSIKVLYASGRNLVAARHVAGEADTVVVVAGLTWKDEGEYIPVIRGGDRVFLGLSTTQVRLIETVAGVNSRCVVVIEGSSAITMCPWIDRVRSVLMAWYPGMEGGNAIAEILFGDVNPSGKLPITFPEFEQQLVPFDTKARSAEYSYYHGYRHFDKQALLPLFHFGYGLSYTRYAYSNLVVAPRLIGKSGSVKVTVDVSNIGTRAGEEIVQMYIGYRDSRIERPAKELKGFARVSLQSGETKNVALEIHADDLAWYDTAASCWKVEDAYYEVLVGSSSRPDDLALRGGFTIT